MPRSRMASLNYGGVVTDDRERVGLRVIAENTPGVKGVHDRLMWVEPVSAAVIEMPQD
ncbi:MAG: hypothetical protein JWL65_7229 [Gammaproteobacteria bacterium]|nr:hypothetical protein [Gammaproteobacteria bacterium]